MTNFLRVLPVCLGALAPDLGRQQLGILLDGGLPVVAAIPVEDAGAEGDYPI